MRSDYVLAFFILIAIAHFENLSQIIEVVNRIFVKSGV